MARITEKRKRGRPYLTQVEELLQEIHMRLGLETKLVQARNRIKELEAELKRKGERDAGRTK